MKKKHLIIFLSIIILFVISFGGLYLYNANKKLSKKDALKLFDEIKNVTFYLKNDTKVFTREFDNDLKVNLMTDDLKKSICFLALDKKEINTKEFNKKYKELFGKKIDVGNFNLIFNNKSTKVNVKNDKLVLNNKLCDTKGKVELHNYNEYEDGNISLVLTQDKSVYAVTFSKNKKIEAIKILSQMQ